MIAVYCKAPEKLSRAMRRVADALEDEAPRHGFRPVTRPESAELVILHVIGWPETARAVAELEDAGKRYAILQYCLRSTQRPDTAEWLQLWAGAAAVWSYYDLPELMAEDGVECDGLPFYKAPLGVDSRVFHPRIAAMPPENRYVITTSGYVAKTEGIKEAAAAARRAGRRMFHLGPDLGLGHHVTRNLGISDFDLATIYSASDYVAGLRRCEGFELPAAEGLLCGARPVVFDRPHYRDHYGRWAYYVAEASPAELEDELLELFRAEPEPIGEDELLEARHYFSWPRVTAGFWRTVTRELDIADLSAAVTTQPRGER